MKRAIIALVIIVAIGAGAGAYYLRRNGQDMQVNTSPVSRGDIVDTVGATGTLQAVTTVQVGSQVSGNIQFLGADFNSIVRKGQVIARLDPSLFQAQVAQARANLLKSRADLTKATSDLERNKVLLQDAEQKFARTKELAGRKLLPVSDLDSAQIAVDSARAAMASTQATLESARAQIEQAQASLNQNQVNLDHTVITAPIDGIVTQRSVDVGQTVAASLQSPTLFIIAADLTKMQVNANIDEADVGRIRPGQNVTFRVDAYPSEEFRGTVAQVRLQPVVVQNVTTYGTVINVPNGELKLKPGMTANVKVEIARRTDVMRVPNTALRFRPNADVFAALNQPVPPEAQFAGGRGGGRGPGGASGGAPGASGPSGTTGASGVTGASGAAPAATPAAPAPQPGPAGAPAAQAGGQGRGQGGGMRGGGGQGGPGGGMDDPERRARFVERLKGQSPDEQKQALARMKERGMDTSAIEKELGLGRTPAGSARAAGAASAPPAQAAQTIDALFAPLAPVQSNGRAWMFVDKQLKPVRVRLGITDGTNTELLEGDLQAGTELVTGVTGLTSTSRANPTGAGNPLMPGGRPGGPMGGGGGRPPGR